MSRVDEMLAHRAAEQRHVTVTMMTRKGDDVDVYDLDGYVQHEDDAEFVFTIGPEPDPEFTVTLNKGRDKFIVSRSAAWYEARRAAS